MTRNVLYVNRPPPPTPPCCSPTLRLNCLSQCFGPHSLRSPTRPARPTRSARSVTGGNAGIGFALCKQLAIDDGCRVYLCARSTAKAQAAVDAIVSEGASAESLVPLVVDVTDQTTIDAAAAVLMDEGVALYGVVNNAGAGLAHGGVTGAQVMDTNLQGPKRVCEAFLPLISRNGGRIVNVSSGCASMYMRGSSMGGKPVSHTSAAQKAVLLSPDVTWEQIEEVVAFETTKGEGGELGGGQAYCLSKASLTAYTQILAKEHSDVLSSSCSPGFIATKVRSVEGYMYIYI